MDYSAFFERKTETVARDLLGRLLIRIGQKGSVGFEIAETGAYVGGEMTPQREGMLYDAGKIFLMSHRGHHMLNIASGDNEGPACVEIRAVRDLSKIISGSAAVTNLLRIPAELDGFVLGEKSGLYVSDEKFRTGKIHTQKGDADNCIGIYTFV